MSVGRTRLSWCPRYRPVRVAALEPGQAAHAAISLMDERIRLGGGVLWIQELDTQAVPVRSFADLHDCVDRHRCPGCSWRGAVRVRDVVDRQLGMGCVLALLANLSHSRGGGRNASLVERTPTRLSRCFRTNGQPQPLRSTRRAADPAIAFGTPDPCGRSRSRVATVPGGVEHPSSGSPVSVEPFVAFRCAVARRRIRVRLLPALSRISLLAKYITCCILDG
jgi:hypothetical protein